MSKRGEVTKFAARSAEELLPLVYDELRKLARHKMGGELQNQTLQATALVHEAYLRLRASQNLDWKDRRYFFAAAAEAMRRILIDNARRKQSLRHGGGLERVDIHECELAESLPSEQLIALDAALERFQRLDAPKAELVKLKFFAGMTTSDAARVLGISEPTAKRHWTFGRAWLLRELTKC
ncbi:MAG: ECF-type sigma factor [Verrucomicrobia bacterium]|nr:ECF-type sigma factor [Verrucomicrobiota bacterium]